MIHGMTLSKLSVLRAMFADRKTRVYVYVGFCALLLALMSFFTCRVADDIGYACWYREYIYQGGDFPGFGPAKEFFIHHWKHVNGRLGDKLIALYLVLPVWTTAAFQFVCSYTMFVFACRLAYGLNWARRLGSVVLTSLFMLVLPWYDSGFLVCMFLNYQVALMLALVWIWYFINPPRLTLGNVVAMMLLSFCAGSWHEQFSLIALPAVLGWQVLKKDRNLATWILTLSFVSGIAFILTCPGWWVRLENEFSPLHINWMSILLKGCVSLPFVIVFACVAILCKTKWKGFMRYSNADWFLMLFSIMQTSGTLYVASHVNDVLFRLWWYASAFSLVAWAIVFKPYHFARSFRYVTTVIVTVCVVVNMSTSLYWQILIKRDFDAVMADFVCSPNGVVYKDVEASYMIPLCTLRKPQRNVFMHYLIPNTCYVRPDGKYLSILPTELRMIETLPLRAVHGAPGFWRTPEGHLLQSATHINRPTGSTLAYKDASGETRYKVALSFPIHASRDSSLVFVWTHSHMFEAVDDVMTPLWNRPD